MRRRGIDAGFLLGLTLEHSTAVLFTVVVLCFAALSPRFLTLENFVSILVQSSAVGIVATGMTFVLLTAGIDLSVGAVAFVAAAVGGKLLLADAPLPLAAVVAVQLGIGAVWGIAIGLLVAGVRIASFMVTLAALFLGRGLALWITETRAMNLPASFRGLAATEIVGLPVPAVVFIVVLVAGHLVLTRTPYGRHVHALGDDAEAARKAGIHTGRIVVATHAICGVCAVAGGIVALAQLGAVSPSFSAGREFEAIAAAVLGGTSLFGGRGSVLPGTLLGTLLIQTLYSGLNQVNADPYSYPVVTGAVIFLAVMADSLRSRRHARRSRRRVRVEESAEEAT